jgi:hypothetical protein
LTRRYFTTGARETSLTAPVSDSDITIQVDSPVGYPAEFPFPIICELGTSSEEAMLVTNVAGNTFTVNRGFDGSTAVAHLVGAKVVHGVTAIEFNEANEHNNASTSVHGLGAGSAIVGTNTSQTLANKTLTSPTINNGTGNAMTLVTPTIASFANAQHDHTDAAGGGSIGISYIGSASNSSSSSGTLNTTYADIPSMSITFTAPDSWPTGATKLTLYLVLAMTTAGSPLVRWTVDGSQAGEDIAIVSSSNAQLWGGIIDLPAAGASHTIKAQMKIATGSQSYSFLGAQLWGSVV